MDSLMDVHFVYGTRKMANSSEVFQPRAIRENIVMHDITTATAATTKGVY